MKFHLYADDSSVYVMFRPQDLDTTVERVELCVTAIRHWMNCKSLKMNDSKTEVLFISSKQLNKKMSFPNVTIGNCAIEPGSSAKLLGAVLDNQISMEVHISAVCKSVQFHLYNIGRIRKYLSKQSTEQLVHALITSKLDYCNSLLIGLPRTLLNRLQRLQNIAARIVNCNRTFCHITPVLRELHWLPVSERVKFKILLLVFKCVNDMAPIYLKDLLVPYQATRSLRSSTQHLLDIPFTRCTMFKDRAFGVIGPRMWNDLPLELRATNSLDIFKSKLKTFLFKQYFD